MSADNWAVCPRCLKAARAEQARAEEAARAAYGAAPVEEFDRLRAEAAKGIDAERLRTFREDWYIGILDDGEFRVSYKGSCNVCHLHHEFKHDEFLDLKAGLE